MQIITKPHAAILTSPGVGHLIPALELAKLMSTHHGFQVTVFVVPGEHSTTSSQLLTNYHHQNLDLVLLPPVNVSAIVGDDASLTIKLIVIMRESLIPLRREIAAMKFRPTMLIVDIFGTEAFSVAEEFDLLQYVFITSNAYFLALSVYSPAAPKEEINGHVNEHKPLKIPGCRSVRFEDSVEPFLDRTPNSLFLQGFMGLGICFSKAHGILVNTWDDLETTTLDAFRNEKLLGRVVTGAVHPIGPLVRSVGQDRSDHPVMDWLDHQPSESVLYVSFGSGGTLSSKQMMELAWGLELSGNRFIWVVRPPSDKEASGSFLSIGQDSDSDCLDYLPDGFLTRTHDVGLVVPMWAPQMDILNHPSVGGFLSHCGWNSVQESLMNGVPMITWPLYAEQGMNAAMLAEEIGVAIRPEQPLAAEDGVVGREEIAEMVRKTMVEDKGCEMRKRAKELKCSGEKALSKDGSSYNSMAQLAKECAYILKAKSGGA